MKISFVNMKTGGLTKEAISHSSAQKLTHLTKQLSGYLESKPSSNKEQLQLRQHKKTINDKRAPKGEDLLIALGGDGNDGM